MASLFALPNELVLSALYSRFPCREQQIRSLATLLSVHGARSRNVVLYGLEATGKSAITKALLEDLSVETHFDTADGHSVQTHSQLRYAIIKSAECISGRHLLEQTVGAIAAAVEYKGVLNRCENLAQLAVQVERFSGSLATTDDTKPAKGLVLVFDGIDIQRDAPPTLVPALARLGEHIPNFNKVFIVRSPHPNFLHLPGVPYIQFPSYTKLEALKIISSIEPSPQLPERAAETQEVWARFCPAVWDSLAKHAGRDIVSFRTVCSRLWPRFIAPILDGTHDATPFSRLLVANRSLFQNDALLVPNIISEPPVLSLTVTPPVNAKYPEIGAQLPYYSRLLLVAAYLASFSPPRTDQLFFMKSATSKRRKKGGGTAATKARAGTTKHRKISRKLLGPQAFVLERMLAIFHAIKDVADAGKYRKSREAVNGSADVQMAIATLASLRLLVKLGSTNAGDSLDGCVRYRVTVGWDVVRGIARSVGLEAEDYLAE